MIFGGVFSNNICHLLFVSSIKGLRHGGTTTSFDLHICPFRLLLLILTNSQTHTLKGLLGEWKKSLIYSCLNMSRQGTMCSGLGSNCTLGFLLLSQLEQLEPEIQRVLKINSKNEKQDGYHLERVASPVVSWT